MANQTLSITPELHRYILETSLREPDVLRRLREETAGHDQAEMQIAPEQGQLMRVLVSIMGARRALEIGVFTGYSSLSVALALPEGGRLVACDLSEDYTSIARRYWKEAGVEDRIELRLGAASDSLDRLLEDGAAGSFDFAFIDADKESYDTYYEQCLRLVRPGGVVLLDNMLRGGRVVEPSVSDSATVAIRRMNEKLRADERVDITLIPIADGLTLARKRIDDS